MNTKIQKVSKNIQPIKANIYAEFIFWYAMPNEEREKTGMKNQNEFAAKHKIHITTLTNWKDRHDFQARVDKIQNQWGQEMTGEVIKGMLKSAVKGNPMSQMLWLQYFKKFNPRAEAEASAASQISVNDIRFLIEGLPEPLKSKHYDHLRELYEDAESIRNSIEAESVDWAERAEESIPAEAVDDAQDVSGERADEISGSDQERLRKDLEWQVPPHHNQSTERWWQEQVAGDFWIRRLVSAPAQGGKHGGLCGSSYDCL